MTLRAVPCRESTDQALEKENQLAAMLKGMRAEENSDTTTQKKSYDKRECRALGRNAKLILTNSQCLLELRKL